MNATCQHATSYHLGGGGLGALSCPILCLANHKTHLQFVVPASAEKAAEVRAQAGEQRPVATTYAAPQVSQAAGSSTPQQQELPADSRAQSLHLCGFDISGVSIAGQVRDTKAQSSGAPHLCAMLADPAVVLTPVLGGGCRRHA